ncbi:nitrite reductase large subunit NirB [Marinobacter sp. M216]|uniref:Nitrite reductase large subunit NirB n=1 Tax=Marinobacter albus TaxID=3030833 RepID=A0ABT7HDP6_9GAMM|nr:MULTISPECIES: nitrite reductase large subunit NirB [unclassified Marinobacter]MBW7471925.1 nitrite reductase large subunit NirB [Marinobacter sp. F4218]MDK9558495.1 nitrite reductase large subunit NirB [Marinobacter sp. M216]
MSKKTLIVIGNGMVGHHFLEQFVATPSASDYEIIVFGEEKQLAYDRVHLSEYFAGSTHADLAMGTADWYTEQGIQLRLNEAVTSLDRDQRTVTTPKGQYRYDELVLATGSYPFVPPIEGREHPHCFVYRTLEDLDAIRASAQSGKSGVVVGGGLLGLEAANALKSLGLQAHVVEFAPRLMPVQLDTDGGALLRHKIEELGVQVHTEKATTAIVEGVDARLRMNFSDDSHLETDLIVFSAGIRPQDALARSSGLEIGERGGIVVNDQCTTSDPHIHAIGECALWDQRIFGLVAPGYTMARTLASVLNGDAEAAFTGADMSTKLKLLGVDVGSIGDAHAQTPGARNIRFNDEQAGHYRRMVISEDGKTLLGAILVGDNSHYDTLLQYTLNDITLPDNPETLILPESQGGAPALGPDALPETASICSCHNVSKGDICGAIDAGCGDLGSVKAETKASTGCGGCTALLKNVVDSELEKRGVEVSKDLCEHFPYSRQELFHLVKVNGIRTFRTLISQHGKGHGCDICKPTVASILATCWNDHILATDHVPLQDTNDTFMANMQKNGTYSIVPRIPGGEITPDKLIVLGEVAKQYNLYTKITGGQRVDLFGATLSELPEIWEKLIAAGFETGHAYGKSLRTVKSCVGSTWCRYGVQDSVGMAILLENRYKGLRAPHKVKMAVSGCTRECAEAQSKDFGVIATENGWNLYVCGNGGMRPRHADLFATDLSDEELIRTIDRVIMFYVRTGDRLQRTSVWMENLEGGLDYLKQVVLEDSLGICAELDEHMDGIVDTYQCEWKTAVEDPEKRKRFREFVNAPEQKDPVQQWTTERDQRRPVLESA